MMAMAVEPPRNGDRGKCQPKGYYFQVLGRCRRFHDTSVHETGVPRRRCRVCGLAFRMRRRHREPPCGHPWRDVSPRPRDELVSNVEHLRPRRHGARHGVRRPTEPERDSNVVELRGVETGPRLVRPGARPLSGDDARTRYPRPPRRLRRCGTSAGSEEPLRHRPVDGYVGLVARKARHAEPESMGRAEAVRRVGDEPLPRRRATARHRGDERTRLATVEEAIRPRDVRIRPRATRGRAVDYRRDEFRERHRLLRLGYRRDSISLQLPEHTGHLSRRPPASERTPQQHQYARLADRVATARGFRVGANGSLRGPARAGLRLARAHHPELRRRQLLLVADAQTCLHAHQRKRGILNGVFHEDGAVWSKEDASALKAMSGNSTFHGKERKEWPDWAKEVIRKA